MSEFKLETVEKKSSTICPPAEIKSSVHLCVAAWCTTLTITLQRVADESKSNVLAFRVVMPASRLQVTSHHITLIYMSHMS